MMEGGMIFDVLEHVTRLKKKTQNECWLTELKYCREDLVVQDDYYCCLNNLFFTVHYNLCFFLIVHCDSFDSFQYIEIIPLHISSWQSGIV
jgi:hypothetical protein